MTDRPTGPDTALPTLDDVVQKLIALQRDAPAEVYDEQVTLQHLIQALRFRKGRFGLHIAVCNEPLRQRELTRQIIAGLPDQQPVELRLTGDEASLLETLLAAPGAPEPLIVYGLDQLLPSSEQEQRRLEQTLSELQLQRERFRRLARPLLLWLPEYAYALIGQRAVDFWSWQSGGFFFTGRAPQPVFAASGQAIRSPQFSAQRALRSAPFDFVGRERQLAATTEALRAGQNVVVHGMAGVGKTELALLAADQLQDTYPDAQLFIALNGRPERARAGLREAIRAFDPTTDLPDGLERLMAIYRSLLRGRRALVVVDDAPDAESVRPFLPPEGSALIVTSRGALALPDTLTVALDQLTPAEARAMLQQVAPRVPDAAADEIAALCGFLPLAIRLAGGLLNENPERDPAEYAAQLREAGLRGLETLDHSVEASIGLSYAPLPEEIARVFRQLSVFPASFDAQAETAVCEDAESAALTELARRSLVNYDESLARYRLHPLVRQFAASRAAVEERVAAAQRHAAYYVEILAAAEKLYNQGGDNIDAGLALFDLEWPNIAAGQGWAAAHADDQEAARLCVRFGRRGANLLSLRLHPRDRGRWLEAAFQAARALGDRAGEAHLLLSLGIVARSLGDYPQARRFYEQALALFQALGDRHGAASALNNLGSVARSLGDYPQARRYHEQALALFQALGDRAGAARALGNLGSVAARQGDYPQARRYHEQALALSRALGDRHGEARALNNLGIVATRQGDYLQARNYYEQALALFQALGDRSGEATALINLGSVAARQDDYPQVRRYHEQALALVQAQGDRDGEANVLMGLGNVADRLGDYPQARGFYEQALALSRALGDRAGEARTLNNLGSVARILGDYPQAHGFYEQALALHRALGDRAGQASALLGLGLVAKATGDPRRAIELYERASLIAREIGAKPIETQALEGLRLARAMLQPPPPLNDVNLTYSDQEQARRVLEDYQQRLSTAPDSERATLLGHLGALSAALGDEEQAIDDYQQALELLGASDDEQGEAVVAWRLGALLAKRGEWERALELMQQRVDYENARRTATAEFYENKLERAREQAAAAGSRRRAEPRARPGWLARLLGRGG